MTATTVPIVCVSRESILTLLQQKQALCHTPISESAVGLVQLLDGLLGVNRQIIEWLAVHIPAELLAQAAQVAAGGEG